MPPVPLTNRRNNYSCNYCRCPYRFLLLPWRQTRSWERPSCPSIGSSLSYSHFFHRPTLDQFISTASNVLATVLGLSLNAALALAFCQYLWRIVRLSSLKVSTIEVLFSLRSNPVLLARADAIRAAPFLSLLAIFMCSIHIAVNFPTGALTVVPANRTTSSLVSVPIFNASSVSMKSRQTHFSLLLTMDR